MISNSVAQRVLLFNVVALPAMLYTGKQFIPAKETLRKLTNLQKQFVCSNTTDPTRHKLNPALVFSPGEEGGLGLQDIQLALQATRCNLADKWLQGEKDIYKTAWRAKPPTKQH
ncbi:hypothetical protein L914_04249 [Phytophthora nicotianae]|uniref:Uncharacterized protein n=1 Tax=Phytophthora nicotianae TaxID=4792 RepID=W2NVN0_PHYNI|nr:hypothetical protein L914_04249 [Phytophthora nicotianae]